MDQSVRLIPQTCEEILHEVFDQSSQGFQVIDREWRYVFVNTMVAKQGKKRQEELIGHTMMEMYPGIEKTLLFAQMKRCMDERVSIKMENLFTFPDGSMGWFQLFIHSWSDGIIIFSVDITERRLEEERLIKKINELEEILSQSPEGKKKAEELKNALARLHRQGPTLI